VPRSVDGLAERDVAEAVALLFGVDVGVVLRYESNGEEQRAQRDLLRLRRVVRGLRCVRQLSITPAGEGFG